MPITIHAIYSDGYLTPLVPLDLQEGERVFLKIERLEGEEENLPPFAPIEVRWKGGLTASEMIIEERREGP